MGFEISKNGSKYKLSPPTWRHDIENEADIIEEIVGDIEDEYDVQIIGAKKNKDGSYNLNGNNRKKVITALRINNKTSYKQGLIK